MNGMRILCLIPCLAAAAPPQPGVNVMSEIALDPAVLRTRVKLTNEYVDRYFGVSKDTTKLNLIYAFGKAARRDWNVQLDLSVVHCNAGVHAVGGQIGVT